MKKTDPSNLPPKQQATSAIVLPPLPYAENALEPVISAKTISFHYWKHHKGYVDTLNKLIIGTEYVGMSLEEIIKNAAKKPEKTAIFNNAAQTWNHTFYWKSMDPEGGGNHLRSSKNKSRHPLVVSTRVKRNSPVQHFRNLGVAGLGLF